MIKIETIQAFISVARYSSFTAAAESHQQTPMPLSKQIASLEQQLGEALFIRTTRRVSLTEFGHEFLEKAHAIFIEHQPLDDWLDNRDNELSGHLSICAQSDIIFEEMIFPWLREFCQLYPKLTFSFDIQDRDNI